MASHAVAKFRAPAGSCCRDAHSDAHGDAHSALGVRRLAAVLAVVLLLPVGVDRGAAALAGRALAGQLQRSGGLSERPDVDVDGFPFLTQALRGRYEQVRLRTAGVVGGVDVRRLDVRLDGARVPLSAVARGRVGAVPVDGVRGDVVLTYPWLSARAGHGLALSGEGDLLRVRGRVRVLGQDLAASALSEVRLERGAVAVRARSFDTGAGAVDGVLASLLADRFDLRVPVPPLPYGLALTGLQVRPEGLLLTTAGGPAVLRP